MQLVFEPLRTEGKQTIDTFGSDEQIRCALLKLELDRRKMPIGDRSHLTSYT